jgi:acyl-CoA thioesterase I
MIRTVVITIVWIALSLASRPQYAAAQTIPPAQAKPVYLAIGDSLTDGLYATNSHGWAYMVADALPQYRLVTVHAAGIDNAIASLPAALAQNRPQLVTVEVGINNISGGMDKVTYLARYVALMRILHDGGYSNVVVCTVPWTANRPGSPEEARALEFNEVINFVAPTFGYKVADCWGATFRHWAHLSFDGFHPADAGHRTIADAVLRAILPPMRYLPDVRCAH